MEHNLDLDKGHCWLSLKDAMGIDHVNPKSWQGKVCVGDVNLNEQWDKGRKKAEKILRNLYNHEFSFQREFSNPQHDILRPRGSYVGVQVTPNDAQSEQEHITPLQRCETVLESLSVQAENAEHTGSSRTQSAECTKGTEEQPTIPSIHPCAHPRPLPLLPLWSHSFVLVCACSCVLVGPH
jgi:hypothetical protein